MAGISATRAAPGPKASPLPLWLVLAAVIPPALWASSVVAAKLVVATTPPFTAATIRFLMAAALMWVVWLVYPGARQHVELRDYPFLAVAGFFQTSLYFALQYAGVEHTTAGNASVLVNTRSLIVLVLAALFLRERLSTAKVAAILVGFAGVLVITARGSLSNLSWASDHAWGDLLILANALSGAIGLVLTKRVLSKYRPVPALVHTMTWGAIGLLPFGAFEAVRLGGIPPIGFDPWLILVYQAVFCSLVAHMIWNNVLVRMQASQAAVFIYVSPLVGVLLAWLLLGESIPPSLLLGTGLIVLAAHLSSK